MRGIPTNLWKPDLDDLLLKNQDRKEGLIILSITAATALFSVLLFIPVKNSIEDDLNTEEAISYENILAFTNQVFDIDIVGSGINAFNSAIEVAEFSGSIGNVLYESGRLFFDVIRGELSIIDYPTEFSTIWDQYFPTEVPGGGGGIRGR